MFVFALVWLISPPIVGYIIGRWWALSVSLLYFPAFLVWTWVTPGTGVGEPVFELWFSYLLLFFILSLPPIVLASVGVAVRKVRDVGWPQHS